MYTPDQLKVLLGFILFSLMGRIMFYREKYQDESFKDKIKMRLISWVWEIPVLLFFGFSGLALMERWSLSFTEAGLISLVLAYFGLEALKIWVYDWINTRWGRRRCSDD